MDNAQRNSSWADAGVSLAKELRRANGFDEAIEISETILREFPSNIKALNQQRWCIYGRDIKSKKQSSEPELVFAAGEALIEGLNRMQPFTPYAITCLSCAEIALENDKLSLAKEWLLRLDENGLDNEPLHVSRSSPPTYWSQLQKYYELFASVNYKEDSYQDAIYYELKNLTKCRNGHSQFLRIKEQINAASKDTAPLISASNLILSEFNQKKHSNQINLIYLICAAAFLFHKNTDFAGEWLSKISPDTLSDQSVLATLHADYNRFGAQTKTYRTYWSAKREYYENYSLFYKLKGNLCTSISYDLKILAECRDDKSPIQELLNDLTIKAATMYEFDIVSSFGDEYVDDEKADAFISYLLKLRGFHDGIIIGKYRSMLEKKHQIYIDWDKETNSPIYAPNFIMIVYQVLKEIFLF